MTIAFFVFIPAVVVREVNIEKTLEVLFVTIGKRLTTACFWAPEYALVIGLALYDCTLL